MKPERIEELRNQKLRDGTREVSRDEWLHLLRCARAVAELEEWLTSETRYDRSVDILGPHARAAKREFELTLYQGGHHGSTQDTAAESRHSDLLTAIEAALAKAKETPDAT